MFRIIALASVAALVAADCPNACSGHGECQTNWDFCQCYEGYLGADCSQRLCEFALSFIDTPTGDLDHDNALNSGGPDKNAANFPGGVTSGSALNPMWRFQGWWERHPAALYGTTDQSADLPFYVRADEGHFYAECSNRGICDRSTGLCDCLTGYEGAACNRTTCVNECSGHGTCETITEVTPSHLYYNLWDSDKTQYCRCDGGYFGADCSWRQCMTNDDPLTITTTTEDYNDGLTETGEVQVVEVRCPYGGTMLDPLITLTYTDDQFSTGPGDKYETSKFDPTDGSFDLAAELKGLPNQVLADFDVDGVNVVSKVTGAAHTELVADKYVRWTVTFDERMGDVPMLMGTPYFKCTGGAEIDYTVASNDDDGDLDVVDAILVTYTGDGPAHDLMFKFTITTADTEASVELFSNGATSATDSVTGFNFADGAITNLDDVDREAGKVEFDFTGADTSALTGAPAGATLTRPLNAIFTVYIHTVPTITVRNIFYELPDDMAAGQTPTPTGATSFVTFAGSTGSAVAALGYDVKNEIIPQSVGSGHTLARWYMNDEFIGYVFITTATPATLSASLVNVAGAPDLTSTFHGAAAAVSGNIDTDHSGADSDLVVENSYVWYVDKAPLDDDTAPHELRLNVGPEVDSDAGITVTYLNNEPPALAFNLVIQIISTSTVTDTYAWKVAGDTAWMDNGGAGYAIPAAGTPTALHQVKTYTEGRYPDDPMRQGTKVLLLDWLRGADHDGRICASSTGHSTSGKYYIQVGTNGLNDAPECSDRGLCDYSTGICKCFKGYAGIDCHEQWALSQGAVSSTA